jgi:hypothetical protein
MTGKINFLSVFFYLRGVYMKRIGSFSLAIIVFTLSIVLCFPYISFADDATTLSKSKDNPFGYSSSEAQSYVSAHKDIYDSDHILLFSYTPTNTYNWTYSQVGKNSLHLSDNQLVAFLMSKKTITAYASMFVSVLSNNNVTRGLLSSVGIATTGDSDSLVNVMDKLTGNYNYLDSLNYDEDSKTITMSNDNGSVDKLREEIKKYYYDSIGIVQYEASGTFSDYINGRYFSHLFEYDEDYGEALSKVKNYKYALADSYINGDVDTSEHAYLWDSSSYIYLSDIKGFAGTSSYGNVVYRLNVYIDGVSSNLTDNLTYYYYYGINNNSYSTFKDNIYGIYIDPNGSYYNKIYPCISDKTESFKPYFNYIDAYPCFRYTDFKFYSYDGEPLRFFKSYSAMYNYLHGDQNAYLSSKIEETGQDISMSIKDMDANLGNKMDTLIDTINSKKDSLSADELQNAIDKGLDDLNKNTEDIKDNTSSILDKLEEQNQILLQILGVTEFIAYQEVKENSDQYNMSYLKTLLDSMFTGLFNALMYGENTVDDKNTDTASMQSFSVSNAAAPVAVYSDDIAVYDSGGSGGGSSFGGGSDSSGGHFFDLKNGLFGKFPFSIPYQCYNWLQILQRDPKAPTFTLDYGYLFGCSGDPKFVLSFDLSRYNDIAEVGRSFCRLFMTLMLALGIYHKNKGEM